MKITIQSQTTYFEATIQQTHTAEVPVETEVPDDFAAVLSDVASQMTTAADQADAGTRAQLNAAADMVGQLADELDGNPVRADRTESFTGVAPVSSVVTNKIPGSILGGVNPTAYAAGTIVNVARDGYSYVSTPAAESTGQQAGGSAADGTVSEENQGNTSTSAASDSVSVVGMKASAAVSAGAASVSSTAKTSAASSSASSGTNLDAIFTEAAETYGVDKKLLLAVAKHESNFRTDVTSSAGAMGVMQLMPRTAAGIGVTDAYDPYQNIMGGARLLADHLKQYDGNLDLALAAYNAGVGTVRKYGGVPPFTEKYIAKIKESMADPTLAAPGA